MNSKVSFSFTTSKWTLPRCVTDYYQLVSQKPLTVCFSFAFCYAREGTCLPLGWHSPFCLSAFASSPCFLPRTWNQYLEIQNHLTVCTKTTKQREGGGSLVIVLASCTNTVLSNSGLFDTKENKCLTCLSPLLIGFSVTWSNNWHKNTP